jgi:hypothetical protein
MVTPIPSMLDPSPRDRAPLRPWSPPRPIPHRPGARAPTWLGGLTLLVVLAALLSAFPTSAVLAPSSRTVAGPTAAPLRSGPATPSASAAPAPPAPIVLEGRTAGLLNIINVPGSAAPTAMAYDAGLGRTILVAPDPSGAAGATVETYSYSQGAWLPVPTANAPSSREYEALTYDATIGRLVLFGGVNAAGAFLNDTWEYAAAGWTNVTALTGTAPTPRAGAHLAGDASGGYDLLFGGYGVKTGVLGSDANLTDTWEFKGGSWTQVATTSSPPVEGAMAYDAALGEVVAYGGSGAVLGCSSATYAFDAGGWTDISGSITGAPAALGISSMTYDPATGGLLLFGGVCGVGIAGIGLSLTLSNTLYELKNGAWTTVSVGGTAPSPRYASNVAFDNASGTLLLFGGADALVTLGGLLQTALLDETYGYAAGSWSEIGPHLVSSRALVEVGEAFTLSVTGIVTPGMAVFNYSGMPARWSARGPVVNCTAATAGTLHPSVNITTTLGLATTATANASANTTLSVLPRHWVSPLNVTRTTTEIGVPVEFSASLGGGFGASTDAFLGLPAGCLSENATVLACDPSASGDFTVTFASTDALGIEANASVDLNVAPRLAVSSVAMSRTAIDLGMSAKAAVTTTGGVGAIAMEYPELPVGCASENATTLACTPSRTGPFNVTARAHDALGVTANATVGLTVNPDPAVVRFALTGAALAVGRSASLVVALDLSGGTGDFTIRYSGLPPGCATPSGGVLDCQPSAAGSYPVRVNATDSVGWSAHAETNLTVAVHTAPNGGGPLGVAGSPFSEGVLAALVLFAVIGSVLGVQRIARRREGDRLARELREGIDSAGEGLADESPKGLPPPSR